MDENLRARIYDNLNFKETEELQEIWQNQDTDEWNPEVFPIIQEILQARLGQTPRPSIRTQVRQLLSEAEDCFITEEWDQALGLCDQAIEIMPDHAPAYYSRGKIYEMLGQPENAITDYQTIVRLDSGLKQVWRSLLRVEADLEKEFQQSSAKQHLDQALKCAYNNAPEKALEECELARETLPGIAIAYNYLGLILEELNQLESAIDSYRKAIRLNPRFYAARENLRNARVKLEEEQYHQAIFEENETDIDFDEAQASEIALSDDPAPGWLYMDECAFLLAGWPGHRTRPGRSGYDPLDADFENAYMEGLILRLLFTRKFRTRHPFYLFLMACLGLMFCLPLLFLGLSLFLGAGFAVWVLVVLSPYWAIGTALLVNLYLSLGLEKPDEYDESGHTFF